MGCSFKIVPWEEFARLYYKNFKSNRGAPTKDARLVLGVIIIKHIMKTDDLGVIEMTTLILTPGQGEATRWIQQFVMRISSTPPTGITNFAGTQS